MRYRLRTLLTLLALGPPLAWIGYDRLVVAMPAETIETFAEFQAEIESESLVIHVDVDWSLNAIANRPLLARLRRKVLLDPRCRSVRWRRMDCTDAGSPLVQSLLVWLPSQGKEPWEALSGYGSLLWIKDGQLIDSLSNPGFEKEDTLFERTLKAFP